MFNNWLTPSQEDMILIDIELYHQVWLTNIINKEKAQAPCGETTKVTAEINFDLISERMF